MANPDSSSSSGRERRRHERAQAEWPISISLDGGMREAKIRDVSRSGVCFFLDRPIEEMTLLEIAFELPERTDPIKGRGAVVRCERISNMLEHFEIAVFLTDMPDPDREAIEKYVSEWKGC
ncbi:MAG: PilZ domain-containing protein [Planctomycetota bacterium]|nr:PilZ domain-containing protein [Planctomycetota bacterium]